MKLSDQVCTLEQAEKLKKLGITQGFSAFAFIKNTCREEVSFRLRIVESEGVSHRGYENWGSGCLKGYSAFTVAELGVMLSAKNGFPTKTQSDDYWYDSLPNYQKFKTEAEARAATLIYLLETNIITAEKVNKRLSNG